MTTRRELKAIHEACEKRIGVLATAKIVNEITGWISASIVQGKSSSSRSPLRWPQPRRCRRSWPKCIRPWPASLTKSMAALEQG